MPSVTIAPSHRDAPSAPEEVESVLRRLAEAPLLDAPYPHSIVRDLIPHDLFTALRDVFPDSPEGMQSVLERRGDSTYSAKRFSRTLPLPTAPESATFAEPIRRVRRLLGSEPVVAALLRHFAGVVGPRLAEHERRTGRRRIPIGTSFELIYDASGFELVPHTDGGRKLVTGLLYVAGPGDPAELGTQLYEPVDPDYTSDGTRAVPKELLRPVSRAPYEANLFVCFARSDRSFHGVEATTSERPRRLIQYSIHLA